LGYFFHSTSYALKRTKMSRDALLAMFSNTRPGHPGFTAPLLLSRPDFLPADLCQSPPLLRLPGSQLFTPTRVTGLGENSPTGWLFTLGSLLKITEIDTFSRD
jgi:hypothetical protein